VQISAQRKFKVNLAPAERQFLKTLIRKGSCKARILTRARILLLADTQKKDAIICQALGIVRSVVYDTRKHYVTGGLNRGLYDLPHPGKARKLTGEQEAEVIAIACSEAPEGRVRWTMDLLTEAVNRKIGVSIGRTAVYKILLRNNIKPWRKKMWCIPFITPEYKKRMLDVLEVYERPYNHQFPVVCLDEKSKQLLSDTRATLRVRRGKPTKADYEYERHGTCNLFVAVEPKAGNGLSASPDTGQRRTMCHFSPIWWRMSTEKRKRLSWLRIISIPTAGRSCLT